jgi:hypothetical protein
MMDRRSGFLLTDKELNVGLYELDGQRYAISAITRSMLAKKYDRLVAEKLGDRGGGDGSGGDGGGGGDVSDSGNDGAAAAIASEPGAAYLQKSASTMPHVDRRAGKLLTDKELNRGQVECVCCCAAASSRLIWLPKLPRLIWMPRLPRLIWSQLAGGMMLDGVDLC